MLTWAAAAAAEMAVLAVRLCAADLFLSESLWCGFSSVVTGEPRVRGADRADTPPASRIFESLRGFGYPVDQLAGDGGIDD